MKQGIALSILASVLFAVLYYYVTVLEPLSGTDVFSWRVLLAFPALALMISRTRGWQEVSTINGRLRHDWKLWLLLLLSAALMGTQLWLFVWAPLHQKALDVSMGYFLLPLAMVVTGRLVYRERLTPIQKLAVVSALAGVVHELYRVDSFSWVTALVVVGYPPYFVLRRAMRFSSLTGLWFDMIILVPVAIVALQMGGASIAGPFFDYPRLLGQVPLMGLISSFALACYFSASRFLPLGLFGIMGYIEPVLLFWVATLLLHESVAPDAWWTYIPIWIAVMLILVEGVYKWAQEVRAGQRAS